MSNGILLLITYLDMKVNGKEGRGTGKEFIPWEMERFSPDILWMAFIMV